MFLPEKGRTYESTPWDWIAFLVVIEFIIGGIAVVICSFFEVNGGWIGIVSAGTGAMTWAMYAEQRIPGVITKKIKSQMALRTTIVMTAFGAAFLWLFIAMGDPESALPMSWLAGLLVVSFLITWGVHHHGLGQGIKMAARAAEAAAKKKS